MATNRQRRPAEPIPIAQPRDPDRSFVNLSLVHLTAGTLAVGLASLLKQVERQPAGRTVEEISYDAERRILDVRFSQMGGNP